MLDRQSLVQQIAKDFAGEAAIDSAPPEDLQKRADDALTRVERYLGVDVEQAKDILERVLEDVS